MRTFKKIAAFVLVNVAIICALNFAISQPSVVDIELNEIQGQDNYDVVVLGQSHGESCISPYVIDEAMNVNSYNCARRLMPLTDVYYMLREVSYNNDVKTVLFEIDPTYWDSDKTSYGTDTTMLFHCNNPRNTFDYIVKETMSQHFLNSIADFSVNVNNLQRMPKVMKVKLTKEYIKKEPQAIDIVNGVVLSTAYEYHGKGFRYGIGHNDPSVDEAYKTFTFDENDIKQKNIDVFNNVVDYCKENNIEVIFYTTAITPQRLKTENHGDAHDYFTALANEKNVQYIDLNYCKSEYLARTGEDYVDLEGHPMGTLADRQTQVLCDIITSGTPEKYLYSSYEEVLESLD